MIERYPEYREELSFPQDEQNFETVMNAIKAVRSRRAEMNVPPSKKPHLIIATDKGEVFESGRVYLSKLAYAGSVEITAAAPENVDGMVSVVTNEARMFMPMAELVDLDKERERLQKELDNALNMVTRTEGKLKNESFVSRAPEAVVNAEKEKLEKYRQMAAKLQDNLKALG